MLLRSAAAGGLLDVTGRLPRVTVYLWVWLPSSSFFSPLTLACDFSREQSICLSVTAARFPLRHDGLRNAHAFELLLTDVLDSVRFVTAADGTCVQVPITGTLYDWRPGNRFIKRSAARSAQRLVCSASNALLVTKSGGSEIRIRPVHGIVS